MFFNQGESRNAPLRVLVHESIADDFVARLAREAPKYPPADPLDAGTVVWSDNIHRAHRVARALRAGTVHVNQYDEDDITVPFGGVKLSGNGRDKSLHAFDKDTELKTTWVRIDPA